MNAVILFKSKSDHERQVSDYIRDFNRVTGKDLQALDVNTKDGADKAVLYDVMQFPAVVAVANDGSLLKIWQGEMPLMNELSYYIKDQ